MTRTSKSGFTRRDFIKTSALVGGAGLAATTFSLGVFGEPAFAATTEPIAANYVLADAKNLLYSTCLQCHVTCQIKAKTWGGTLAKLTGNPYSPQNYLPHLDYETSPFDAATADGKLCPKGQSGIQTYADPYRVRKVLKRQGPRGSNKWKAIPFDQFINEVVAGGSLFSEIGDDRHYPGFDEVVVARDPDVTKALAQDAASVANGDMSVDEFKTAHAEHLDLLIDAEHPDLGLKNNQFVFQAGRIEHGRKELMKRFTKGTLGSVNAFEHTTICEQSHHIAYKALTNWKAEHMKPDLERTEFVIFWGTGAFSANFGMTPMAEKVTNGRLNRGLKMAVIDPRLSNDAGKADWWLPVKPGTDLVLALGMIRWMLDNNRYDARYLANANKAAATADGETTWSNGTYLIKEEADGRQLLLRADEAGVGSNEEFVVLQGGTPLAVNPDDEENPVEGDLFVDTTVAGVSVKSGLQLLKEEASSRTLDEVTEITTVPRHLIEEVTRELTSHGKRAAVDLYRGPVQHTNGFHAGEAVILLNVLLGNADWAGGLSKGGGHWHEFGGKDGSVYDFSEMNPGALQAFGIKATREGTFYEKTTLYQTDGYPAKRPFFPYTGNVYQEIIPSFVAGYPYPGKILMTHLGTPALSTPAGHTTIEMLLDPDKVPLFIASDIIIGETSMYADYILPDVTYMERWGTPHVTPDVTTKTSKIRQPVAVPLTEEVEVDGERMPIQLETFMIAVAKKLGLSGFGKNALGNGMDLNRPVDWYLKAVANIAYGDDTGDAVPDADADELALFEQARRHLPPTVFRIDRWKQAVRPQEWPKVVYALNRGGRFAPHDSAVDGEYLTGKLGSMFYVFQEKITKGNHSITGKPFSMTPIWRGQRDSADRPLNGDPAYPFDLFTYKEPWGGQSRTITNYWSTLGLVKTNYVLMNRVDTERLGLQDGQQVRLVSKTNTTGRFDLGNGKIEHVTGPLKAIEGILPGTVAASWHFGHWAYGSNDVEVDGELIKGDERRAAGICPNAAMLIDPSLGDVCMTDPIGGSASFYDTSVAVLPA